MRSTTASSRPSRRKTCYGRRGDKRRSQRSTCRRFVVLDPDGDLVRRLKSNGQARLDPSWSCYHTQLYRMSHVDLELGFVGCAVGSSFAVLVAEELFASGCGLLISMTSAGQLVELRPPPYFVLIERALRDEGTSYHYLPPAEFSSAKCWAAGCDDRCAAWAKPFGRTRCSLDDGCPIRARPEPPSPP